MILQPHSGKRVCVVITGVGKTGSGSNFKITKHCQTLVSYYHQQYMDAHKTRMGLAHFCHIMCKFFGDSEPWIFKEGIDKSKFYDDVLYSIQSCKTIFNAYVPDVKIKNQSDALVSLVAWNMARVRAMQAEGKTDFRGFVDFIDRDDTKMDPDIEDFSKLTKKQLSKLLPPVIVKDPLANVKDLLESAQSMRLPIPEVES